MKSGNDPDRTSTTPVNQSTPSDSFKIFSFVMVRKYNPKPIRNFITHFPLSKLELPTGDRHMWIQQWEWIFYFRFSENLGNRSFLCYFWFLLECFFTLNLPICLFLALPSNDLPLKKLILLSTILCATKTICLNNNLNFIIF